MRWSYCGQFEVAAYGSVTITATTSWSLPFSTLKSSATSSLNGRVAAADLHRIEVDVPIQSEIEHRREQHDAVDADPVLLQVIYEHRGARRAIGFAEEKLR